MNEKCVCWDEKEKVCVAIKPKEYENGYNCGICSFFKTKEQYKKETGLSYEQAMKIAKVDTKIERSRK